MIDKDRFAQALYLCGISLPVIENYIRECNVGEAAKEWSVLLEYKNCPSHVIHAAFCWAQTPENYDFWELIHRTIDDTYDNLPKRTIPRDLPVGKIPRPRGRKYLCA